jgi:hypothetical protein
MGGYQGHTTKGTVAVTIVTYAGAVATVPVEGTPPKGAGDVAAVKGEGVTPL